MNMKWTMYNPKFYYKIFDMCAPTEIYNNAWRKGPGRCEVHDPTAYILDGVCGNAGLFSNANDLTIFMKMMLNHGIYVNPKNKKEI